jgi:hypothetical protein
MANVITTNYFREQLAAGNVNLSGDDFAIALMNIHVQSASVNDLKEVKIWSEISDYESSSVGYSAVPIDNKLISTITGNVISWSGDNISWSSITNSPYGYAIYKIDDGLVVGMVEFNGAPINAVNGTITIQWNSAGIANII